jgi:transposase-like protein
MYRNRWTHTHAQTIVEDLEASGLTMAEFARRRGLDVGQLRRWRIRIREETPSGGGAGLRLVELVARRESIGGRVQIRCPSGHVVELEGVEIEEGLRAALNAIGGGASPC